jgi:hypothetical protein
MNLVRLFLANERHLSEGRIAQSTGYSLQGAKLESSELIKEFEINSNILNWTNNRVASK